MGKAVYRVILFVAIAAFVLSASPSVAADPNGAPAKQNQVADSKENIQVQLAKEQLRGDFGLCGGSFDDAGNQKYDPANLDAIDKCMNGKGYKRTR